MNIEPNIEPFGIQKFKYNRLDVNGNIIILNRIKYNWRDLNNISELKNIFIEKRRQKFSKDKQYSKPTRIICHNQNIEEESFDNNKLILAVCLPCFDEEWSEMSGTLRSLSKNLLVHRKRPDKTHELHVIVFIIQDGWEKSTKSFRKGITEEFLCPDDRIISGTFKNNKEEQIVMVIPNDEIYYPCYMDKIEEKDYTGTTFHPIFITKSRNAQKHNSHLIFFSLCSLLKPDLVFLTDCGTIYNSDCLHKLIQYLHKKQNKIIAVTARQRVMDQNTRKQVRDYPSWWKKRKKNCCLTGISNFIWWISPAPLQGFEFESTFILNTAMFNVLGALPVLPGPCQLIWWEHLETSTDNEKSVLDMYFHHLNIDITKSGIIRTNTLLAEDRILSFAMVLRTMNLSTVWVSGATFSYEPMTTWVQLLGQRRRWVNGTIATYIFYLLDEKGQDEFAMSALGDSRTLQSLWGVQLYQSLLQILSPAFFSIAVYESSILTYKKYPNLYSYSYSFIDKTMIIAGAYYGFYVLWVLTSMFFGKRSNCVNKYFYNFCMEIIYSLFALVNTIVSLFILYNIFASANVNFFTGPAIYILIVIWVIPFILALMLSFSSAFLYIIYGIPFMLHIIQYVAFIPSYAFARMHDLSWGNRDSSAFIDSSVTEWKFFWITCKANFLLIIINFLILCGYIILINYIGRSLYTFIPLFFILFIPTIIQIGFAMIYIINMITKNLLKNCKNSISSKNSDVYSIDLRRRSDII